MTQEQAKPTQPLKSQTAKAKPKAKKRKARPRWMKTTGALLKYLGIPLLFIVCLYVGLYIGYVKLGDQPAHEIFDWSTWRHVYDLVFAEG